MRPRGESTEFLGHSDETLSRSTWLWLRMLCASDLRKFRAVMSSHGKQVRAALETRASYGVALWARYLGANDPDLVLISLRKQLPERDV